MAQVGSVCLGVTLLRCSIERQVLLPGSDRVKMGLTVGLDMTVLLRTWSNLTEEPHHSYSSGGGQLFRVSASKPAKSSKLSHTIGGGQNSI